MNWAGTRPPDPGPVQLKPQSRVGAAQAPAGGGRLIHGDNLAVLAALRPQLSEAVDLVYVDPPFHTGKRYSARVGFDEDSRRPATWRTRAGYDDRWADLPSYLSMLRPRLEILHQLLAPTGTLYIHLDWHSAAYVRVVLDEIFGPDRLLNEIVWIYHGPSPIRRAFSRKHDTLLAYTKSAKYTFNADAVRIPYDEATWKAFRGSEKAGFGKRPDLERGKVPEDWWYFPVVARLHRERTGYPTQKPLALVERIVAASSRPGDLVVDAFAGSGTALVAAAGLGRRWLGIDTSQLAVATTYRRLLLECPGEAFEFLSTADPSPKSLGRQVRIERDGGRLEIALRSPTRFQWLEADWDYDGRLFRSRAQVARPWRSGSPLPGLTQRTSRRGPQRVAVRAADAAGRIHFGEAILPARA